MRPLLTRLDLCAQVPQIERMDFSSFLKRASQILGPRGLITEPEEMAPYLHEPRDLFNGRTFCVARPHHTQEVAALLALCQETQTSLVPQGGNTGLVGGQIPDPGGQQLVLSLSRMDRVREVDIISNVLCVEAGLTLAKTQEVAKAHHRLFPLSLASEGSATIGGVLATNAGGTNAICYGVARDLVLGVEVVLASGEILTTLSCLRKDNTGYPLTSLFLGSEGTLGIITAASLKLFPLPRRVETAFIGVQTPQKALDFFLLAQEYVASDLKTFELMPRLGIEFVLKHGPQTRDPLSSPHPWAILLELSSQHVTGLEEALMALLEKALEQGLIEDAAHATSLEQRAAFWRLRELMSEVQKAEGGSIKHDVSVPIAHIPAFLEAAHHAVTSHMPGIRPVPFGHMGDGNIHYNLSQPLDMEKHIFLSRWEEMNEIVHGLVLDFGGSVSAEHGIGLLKRDLLPKIKSPTAMHMMYQLKQMLDPQGILNPGKVI